MFANGITNIEYQESLAKQNNLSMKSKLTTNRSLSSVLPNKREEKMPNGVIPSQNNALMERRPSGVFPKMGPNMNRIPLKSFKKLTTALASIEEDDDEEIEKELDIENNSHTNIYEKHNAELSNITESYMQEHENIDKKEAYEHNETSNLKLSKSIQRECFVNKTIQIRKEGDLSNVDSEKKLRVYFSSKLYLKTFRYDFDILASLFDKSYLLNSSYVEGPAIRSADFMIDQVLSFIYLILKI